jgi:hypothetical protein
MTGRWSASRARILCLLDSGYTCKGLPPAGLGLTQRAAGEPGAYRGVGQREGSRTSTRPAGPLRAALMFPLQPPNGNRRAARSNSVTRVKGAGAFFARRLPSLLAI